MRTNLKPFLARLALIALITLGVSVRLPAHDLPADRSLAETVTANCFTSSPAVASQPSAPHVDVWSQQTLLHYALRRASPTTAALTDQLEQASTALSNTWTRTQNLFNLASTLPNSLVAIAPPDVGVAPRPYREVLPADIAKTQSTMAVEVDLSSALPKSLLAINPPDVGTSPRPNSKWLPVAMAKAQPAKAGEVYMAYDFRMSDWRFGQFPYHGKTASAPRPTALPSLADGSLCVPSLALPNTAEEARANPPTRPSEALGNLLQQFEQLQCVTSAALSSGPALARSASSIADSIERFVVASRRALLSGKPSATAPIDQRLAGQAASPSTDLVGPQFVVYGTAIGEHVVLTLAQARAWQFEMPLANSRLADRSRLMELLDAGLKPIQTSVLATATSGLQRAGQTLLNLSQSLSNISEPRVASGPQANPF